MKLYKGLNIIRNDEFGYYELRSKPDEDELNNFYEKRYYEVIKSRNKDSMSELMKEDSEKEELEWLRETEYKDICYYLGQYKNETGHALDIGCGNGNMLAYLKEHSWHVKGIEPSFEAAEKARNKKIDIYNGDFKTYVENNEGERYDFVNMTNVLEHVIDPKECIEKINGIIKDNGILRVKVPNDFNEFQNEYYNKEQNAYWVCPPEHITYFSMPSLKKLLIKNGFKIKYVTCDFPMEIFLMMEEDYINSSEVGKEIHKKRKTFEKNVSDDFRRKIYNNIAQIGLGRNIIVYASKITNS